MNNIINSLEQNINTLVYQYNTYISNQYNIDFKELNNIWIQICNEKT